MMKKVFLFALILCLLPLYALADNFDMDISATLRPGQTFELPQGTDFALSDSSVASLAGSTLTALANGTTVLTYTLNGAVYTAQIVVDDTLPPQVIQDARAIAYREWETYRGHRIDKSNKYTKWYCGRPCTFGWCGGFCGWCLDSAGLEMCRVEDAEPITDGRPYGIAEASVGKLFKGYTNLGRTTHIPRPGYLVIYAVRNRANKTIHIGFVYDVKDLGDELYLITTIEGNVSNQVKSYNYYYNASAAATEAQNNMIAFTADEQVDENICYKLHDPEWYINCFCMTYE